MDLLQLRYFQVTAKHENITHAANELLISQPALSKMIRKLETELDIKLFDRKGKNIFLNTAGEKFLKWVNLSLYALEQGVSEMKDIKNGQMDTITLYVTVGSMLLPKLLQQFRTKFPKTRFNLTQHTNKSISYNFAITSEPLEGNEHIILLEEEILLGVPISHPLSHLDSVSLKDLEKEKFISLTSGKPLRHTTNKLFEQVHYEPDIIFESDDPATVRGLIQEGLGISFIPSILWKNVRQDPLKLLHISEPECKRTIYLCYPSGHSFTNVEKSLFDFLVGFFEEQINESQGH